MRQGDVFYSSQRGVYRSGLSFIGWERFCPGRFGVRGYWYRAYGVSASEMILVVKIKAAIPER